MNDVNALHWTQPVKYSSETSVCCCLFLCSVSFGRELFSDISVMQCCLSVLQNSCDCGGGCSVVVAVLSTEDLEWF